VRISTEPIGTIVQFEATGSPVITDGEQRKYHNFWTCRAITTHTGDIHTLSFTVNVACIILAIVLLSVSFWSDPRWRVHRRTALTLTALILPAFVFQFYTLFFPWPHGIANRLFVTLLLTWLLSTTIDLRALGRE